MEEVQLTFGPYGHMLNSTQVFSPDNKWVAYDVRNDGTHISQTCCIEKVHTGDLTIRKLYSSPNQTMFGPGVGAVSYHPSQDKLIFIHGLFNCSQENPYSFTRRFGAILDENMPGKVYHAEARAVNEGFLLPGALRGGTHAHSWSADGEWVSFTYNDFVMERMGQLHGVSKDLRTIGVMSPVKKVSVSKDTPEEFSGQYFAVVAATVTENPQAGSDEIDKAFDECWVGKDGYVKSDYTKQKRAVAFQGNVKDGNGNTVTEVFVSDIPDDITKAVAGKPLEGTSDTRPNVPLGLTQRRVTFTAGRKFPGLQGPRFWLRTSPDGKVVYFLMKDDEGVVQVFEIPANGGAIRQVTTIGSSIQSQFNLSPDGKRLAFIAGNSIWITDIGSGKSTRITAETPEPPVLGVLWSNDGRTLVFNRYVQGEAGRHLQIFKLNLN